jgi:ribosome-associated translation inhibitor RaiA
MKVLLNSDNRIEVNDVLRAIVQGEVDRALGRFEDRLTRVEVYLSDLNGPKEGPLADKRCVVEARPAGRQPLVASDDTETVTEAIAGAVNKMKRQLESELGREAEKR